MMDISIHLCYVMWKAFCNLSVTFHHGIFLVARPVKMLAHEHAWKSWFSHAKVWYNWHGKVHLWTASIPECGVCMKHESRCTQLSLCAVCSHFMALLKYYCIVLHYSNMCGCFQAMAIVFRAYAFVHFLPLSLFCHILFRTSYFVFRGHTCFLQSAFWNGTKTSSFSWHPCIVHLEYSLAFGRLLISVLCAAMTTYSSFFVKR